MERTARTLLQLILVPFLASVVFGTVLHAADDNRGMRAAVLDYILPQYRGHNGSLQFVVFGDEAMNRGSQVFLEQAKIDVLPNSVRTLDRANIYLPHTGLRIPAPYPITANQRVRSEYWSHPKQGTVRAWIYSNKAVYVKSTRILRSDDPVLFRSRELDADGVGFDAYHEKKFIHIRSNVKVYIRPEVRRAVTRDAGNGQKQEK